LKGAKIKPIRSAGPSVIIDSDLDAFVVAFYAMVRVKFSQAQREE
jgi:hypothetical protein